MYSVEDVPAKNIKGAIWSRLLSQLFITKYVQPDNVNKPINMNMNLRTFKFTWSYIKFSVEIKIVFH